MTDSTEPDLKGVPAKLGRYRLRFKLASGGMASVFLARATGTGNFEKVVAVKTIHQHLVNEGAAVRMFMDEARIASAISHPNVAQVFDFGEEDGTHYLVMEYLFGEPLSRVTKKLGTSEDTELKERIQFYAARIIADAAEGLHAAHELKDDRGSPLDVVHRDVSPQNIFVTYEGSVKVVDFGVARARARLEQTRAGDFKGKYEYIAPEQIRGTKFDRRVDIWALGVCLWEMLALRRLFRRDEIAATIAAISSEELLKPSQYNPGIAPELEAVVMKALSRDPAQRFQTAREFSRALRAFLTKAGELVDVPEVGDWMSALFPEDKVKRQAMRDAVSNSPADELEPAPIPIEFTVSEESRSLANARRKSAELQIVSSPSSPNLPRSSASRPPQPKPSAKPRPPAPPPPPPKREPEPEQPTYDEGSTAEVTAFDPAANTAKTTRPNARAAKGDQDEQEEQDEQDEQDEHDEHDEQDEQEHESSGGGASKLLIAVVVALLLLAGGLVAVLFVLPGRSVGGTEPEPAIDNGMQPIAIGDSKPSGGGSGKGLDPKPADSKPADTKPVDTKPDAPIAKPEPAADPKAEAAAKAAAAKADADAKAAAVKAEADAKAAAAKAESDAKLAAAKAAKEEADAKAAAAKAEALAKAEAAKAAKPRVDSPPKDPPARVEAKADPKPDPKKDVKKPRDDGPEVRIPSTSGSRATGLVRVRASEKLEVYVDGKQVGVTNMQVELPVGQHRIELRTPGAPAGSVQLLNVEFAAEYLVEAN